MTDLKLVRRWACVDRKISTLLTDSRELDVKWRAHIMSETAKDSMERWNTYRVVRGNLWGCDGRFSNSGSDVSNRNFMGMTDGKRGHRSTDLGKWPEREEMEDTVAVAGRERHTNMEGL